MRFVILLMLGLQLVSAERAYSEEHPTQQPLIRRGEYLSRIMGCNDCHTPLKMGEAGPEPDLSRMLSGHPESVKITSGPKVDVPWGWVGAITNTAYSGPWGITFSANLTPDPETGLGSWTEKNFIDTMRTGRHMGKGRPILPPMPIPALNAATDEDLKSLFAYLQSIPAVKNRVADPIEPSQE